MWIQSFFTGGDREEARARLGLPPKKTIFLFVGRLHPWKGIPELVEAARACPEHLFLFIGPGSPPDHPDNCIFFGTVPHREVRAWMNAADCLVLPTHTEAVPTSVMEAFACGIPAITTNIGGCPEIVTDQKNGLMVPVGDTGALAAAVEWMGSHEEERMQMGHDARATVVQRYDHRIMTARLIGIHTTVLENTRAVSLRNNHSSPGDQVRKLFPYMPGHRNQILHARGHCLSRFHEARDWTGGS